MRSTVRAGHVVVWLLAAISGNVPVATPAESTSATQRPGAPNETPIATSDAFPERGTAHPGAGELTMVDHVNRMAVLRPDRTDAQNKYHQDLPHHVALLPYAELFSCGARANLEDIPLGTHLFGWFHLGPRGWFAVRLASTDYEATVKNEPNERSPDAPYCRAIRLEDDFSFDARRDVVWEIVSIDRENRKVVARLTAATSAEHLETPASLAASDYEAPLCLEGEQTFDFDSATRVWKGQGLFTVEDLAPGLRVLLNRTWATLYGPGRLTDVWVDVESRRRAIERQARRFIEHERFRGVPARIESIEYGENASGVVTVTLYAAVSAVAREAVVPKSRGAVIVVEPTLRSHDQGNDGVAITFQDVTEDAKPPPGSSGIHVRFQIGEMLEGMRPGNTVRIQAAEWPRITLPREERLSPFDVHPKLIDEDGEQRTTAPFSR